MLYNNNNNNKKNQSIGKLDSMIIIIDYKQGGSLRSPPACTCVCLHVLLNLVRQGRSQGGAQGAFAPPFFPALIT